MRILTIISFVLIIVYAEKCVAGSYGTHPSCDEAYAAASDGYDHEFDVNGGDGWVCFEGIEIKCAGQIFDDCYSACLAAECSDGGTVQFLWRACSGGSQQEATANFEGCEQTECTISVMTVTGFESYVTGQSIECPGDCTETDTDCNNTLQAHAINGDAFDHWGYSGDCGFSDPTVSVLHISNPGDAVSCTATAYFTYDCISDTDGDGILDYADPEPDIPNNYDLELLEYANRTDGDGYSYAKYVLTDEDGNTLGYEHYDPVVDYSTEPPTIELANKSVCEYWHEECTHDQSLLNEMIRCESVMENGRDLGNDTSDDDWQTDDDDTMGETEGSDEEGEFLEDDGTGDQCCLPTTNNTGKIVNNTTKIVNNQEVLADGLSDIDNEIATGNAIMEQIEKNTDGIESGLRGVKDSIDGLGSGIDSISNDLGGIADGIGDIGQDVTDAQNESMEEAAAELSGYSAGESQTVGDYSDSAITEADSVDYSEKEVELENAYQRMITEGDQIASRIKSSYGLTTSNGKCSEQIYLPNYNMTLTMSFCEHQDFLNSLGAIMVGVAYLYCVVVVLRG